MNTMAPGHVVPEDAPQRDRSLPAHGVLLVVAITYAVVAQGAFFGSQLAIVQALIGVALITAMVAARPARSDLSSPASVAVAIVAAPTLLSAAAAGLVTVGLLQVAFLLTLLGVVLTVRRLGRDARQSILGAVIAVGSAVGLCGWFGVAFHATWAAVWKGLWRSSVATSYVNATGCLLMMCSLVALALVISGSRIAPFAAYATLTGLASTFSRGAALAFVVGMAFMTVRAGWQRTATAVWPTLAAAAIAAVGLLPSMASARRTHPAVAIAGLVAGAGFLLLKPSFKRRAIVLAIAAAAIAFAASPALRSDVGQIRYFAAIRDRGALWSESLDVARSHPVLGEGPRSFLLHYDSGSHDAGRFAHNEYLQVLAEQGLVGLAAVLLALLLLARHLLRSRSDGWTWLGSSAALGGLLVHAGTDFVWSVPVIPLIGCVLLAAAGPRQVHDDEHGVSSRDTKGGLQ